MQACKCHYTEGINQGCLCSPGQPEPRRRAQAGSWETHVLAFSPLGSIVWLQASGLTSPDFVL